MNKSFWAIIAIIVIVFGGIIFVNKKHAATPSGTTSAPTSHITGQGSTGVTLMEYADYQCPYCAEFYPLVKQVATKYQDKMFYQFRNLPLPGELHPNARAAARAAEAADSQGKFWEMHDLIFQNHDAWEKSSRASQMFEQYALQLGLDITKFKNDVADPATNNHINADIAEFNKTKQPMSTPTFFLDGKKIQATSLDEFSRLIDQAIAAKQKP